jgi:hypothetical protein
MPFNRINSTGNKNKMDMAIMMFSSINVTSVVTQVAPHLFFHVEALGCSTIKSYHALSIAAISGVKAGPPLIVPAV